MRGAIIGDVIGSPYEGREAPNIDFELFRPRSTWTDDSICTAACATAMLDRMNFRDALRSWGRRYPDAGYGPTFEMWLQGVIDRPYNSYGNGSVMRASSCARLAKTPEDALILGARSCSPTHDHPDSLASVRALIRGMIALRNGEPCTNLRTIALEELGEAPPERDELLRRPSTVRAKDTTLNAFGAMLAAWDFESALRIIVTMGGDTDTAGAVTGALAESAFPIPSSIWTETMRRLPADVIATVDRFDHALGTVAASDLPDPTQELGLDTAIHDPAPYRLADAEPTPEPAPTPPPIRKRPQSFLTGLLQTMRLGPQR